MGKIFIGKTLHFLNVQTQLLFNNLYNKGLHLPYIPSTGEILLALETLVSSHSKIFSSQFHARSDAKDLDFARKLIATELVPIHFLLL